MTIRILREANACPDPAVPTRMDFLVGDVHTKSPVFEAQAVAEGWAEYLIEDCVTEAKITVSSSQDTVLVVKAVKKRRRAGK